jgi:hypothetical protein
MKDFIKKPICLKCGGKDIAITYHRGSYQDCVYSDECRWLMKEHMAHYCRTCSFKWATKVFKRLTNYIEYGKTTYRKVPSI